MKKIRFVMHTMIGRGAEGVLIDILEALDPNKYEVELLLLIKTGPMLKRIPANVKLSYLTLGNEFFVAKIPLFFNKITRKIKLWYYCNYPNRLNNKFNSSCENVVYIAFLQWYTARFVNRLNIKAKKISWVHIDLSKAHGRYCEKNDFSQFQEIVFVSDQAKLGFEKFIGERAINGRVIYNLLNEKRILELSKRTAESSKFTHNSLKICCVGSLSPQKRFDKSILAIKELSQKFPNVELHIIGDGDLKKQLNYLVIENNIEKNVVFWGYDENPYRIMKCCDVFLLSSDFEGFGLVVAEAMILGLPVVSTKCAGPVEITNNGEFGVLVGGEVSDISTALEKFLNRKEIEVWSEKSLNGWGRLKEMSDIGQIESILDNA